MMVSLSGTPGVGKTTISREMTKSGWRCLDIKDLIIESGAYDQVIEGSGEILVDEMGLREFLGSMDLPQEEQIIIDGHLSYLAPSDICIVLRTEPGILKERLSERDYSPEKIMENVEAEAVSVILVEAKEMEEERLKGREWTLLPRGCGIVFEVDASNRSVSDLIGPIMKIIEAYRGKRLNELFEYRPGRIDWLEEMVEWF